MLIADKKSDAWRVTSFGLRGTKEMKPGSCEGEKMGKE
jgi:hypothetical protein